MKEGPAWLFSTLPFCSTAFHTVPRSVFPPASLPYLPSLPCDLCCLLSSRTPFSPFSTLSLHLWHLCLLGSMYLSWLFFQLWLMVSG